MLLLEFIIFEMNTYTTSQIQEFAIIVGVPYLKLKIDKRVVKVNILKLIHQINQATL